MTTTIIFDAEGVVFNSESIWDRGQTEFLRRRGIIYNREQIKPLLTGRSLIEGARVMQDVYGFAGDPESLAQERLSIVTEFFTEGVNFIEGFLHFHEKVAKKYKGRSYFEFEMSLW